jgi:hypothetical protein
MKAPEILPAGGSGNLQLTAMLPEKICVHSGPRLIIHGSSKVKSITMHGSSFCYKVGNQSAKE